MLRAHGSSVPTRARTGARTGTPTSVLVAALTGVLALAGCTPASAPGAAVPTSGAVTAPTAASPTTGSTTGSTAGSPGGPASAAPSTSATARVSPAGRATPAPGWLGHRALPLRADGFGRMGATPAELDPRSIETVDVLPPPTDGAFHSAVTAVPAAVVARSTWSPDCPVALADLRYVTVTFLGFDGRPHTGELLVHRTAAPVMVAVFRALYREHFPIERMVVTTVAERDAAPTGDGNTTGAFVCRPVAGGSHWSEHAYGRAVDVNPFQNPYLRDDVVLPELARSYTHRDDVRPGMLRPGSAAVRAFTSRGWGWGGNWRSLKDYMHFSAGGR